jgi:hypothetical protein
MQEVETKENVGGRDQSEGQGCRRKFPNYIIIFYSDEAKAHWRELELGSSSVGVKWSKFLLYSRHSKSDSS